MSWINANYAYLNKEPPFTMKNWRGKWSRETATREGTSAATTRKQPRVKRGSRSENRRGSTVEIGIGQN